MIISTTLIPQVHLYIDIYLLHESNKLFNLKYRIKMYHDMDVIIHLIIISYVVSKNEVYQIKWQSLLILNIK